jgi:hypothetical protein
MAETQDQRADRLAKVAVELVGRVRDETADTNWQWFLNALPDPLDREHIAFILAAAVPVDESWKNLTCWAYVSERFGRINR